MRKELGIMSQGGTLYLVNLLRQISLTFWVEANESLDLVVLIRLMNKLNGRNVFITCGN